MEPAKVEAVWKQFRARLFNFIRARVSSPEEAEDLTQEVFVRLHTGLCCLQEWTSMERWIFRVARNLIIDHYRARKRFEPLEGEPESGYGGTQFGYGETESGYGWPELDDDSAASLALSLKETVDELPEPYRQAMILTEFQGLTQSELAERTGISLAAAKSRILRGREKLKALLLACCHFELDSEGRIVNYEKRCASCDLLRNASRSGDTLPE